MRSRGRSQISSPESFSKVSETSPPADVHLFSILQRIAPLLAKLDQFQAISSSCCVDQKIWIASSLDWEVDQLIDELEAWLGSLHPKGELSRNEQSTLYLSWTPSYSISNPFSTMLCFPSIRVATSTLFCRTGLLFLSTIKHTIAHALPMPSFAGSRCDETALCIARSFEYFLHPDIGLFGTYIIGFPMAAARAYFEQRDTIGGLSWLGVIEARIIEVNSGLGDFLREVKSDSLLPRPME